MWFQLTIDSVETEKRVRKVCVVEGRTGRYRTQRRSRGGTTTRCYQTWNKVRIMDRGGGYVPGSEKKAGKERIRHEADDAQAASHAGKEEPNKAL